MELGVLSVSTENNYNEKEVAVESLSSVSKRQTNFQNNNFNQPQVKYFKYKAIANWLICFLFSFSFNENILNILNKQTMMAL